MVAQDKVDMSLDDIISSNKKIRGAGRGNRQNQGRRIAGRGSGGRGFGNRNFRGTGNRPRGNIDGQWSHDMHFGGGVTIGAGGGGPTKINISNLDFGVSDSDIRELFFEFGAIRSVAVHYDRSGRSVGTAHVNYERRADALKAIRQYNGVHLDGRPMRIILDGETGGGTTPTKRLQQGSASVGGGRGRGGVLRRGGGRGNRGGRTGGRGGRREKEKVPTAEELDAELDAYTKEIEK